MATADNTTTAPEDTLAEDDDSDLATFQQIKQWWKEADQASREWREDAEEDYAFVAGDQWTQEDKAKLAEQNRPVVTINRVGPVVDSVSGMEVSNRQEVRYIPRTEGDAGVNEVLTGAAQWMRDECDAEDEESDAFLDDVICGMAWTETRLDYETDPEGMIQINRVDPLEMWWDTGGKKRNLDDGRFVIRLKRDVPIDEARALFPDADDDDLDASGWVGKKEPDKGEAHDSTPGARDYKTDHGGADKFTPKKVTLVEAQWWERETRYRVVDPTSGQAATFDKAKFGKLQKRAAKVGMPLKAAKQQIRVYKRAFVGSKLLAPVDTPCEVSFTYRCITGKRDRNKGTWYGLVRAMKDPQRWANKFFSTLLHHIQTSGKGIMAARDLFDNPRKAEEEWARQDSITWLKAGADASKIMPKTPSAIPTELSNLMQFAVSSIRDATGVNVEMLGLADREQAGVLEAQRTKAGMVILATLFDSLRRYRKEQGRVLLWFIQNHLSDGRLVRIVGPQGMQYLPLVRQSDTYKYDVIVDDSPTSPNQKEATWLVLGQLMPQILGKVPLPVEAWVEILKQSPLPDSFAEKLGKILTDQKAQQAQQPPPPDPAMAKVQAQIAADQQAQQAQMAADQQAQANKQQMDQADMALQVQKQQQQQEMAAQQQAFDQDMAEREFQFQAALEARKAQIQAARDLQKNQHEQQTAEQRFALESDMAQKKADAEGAIKGRDEAIKSHGDITSGIQKMTDTMSSLHEALTKPRTRKTVIHFDGKRTTGATTTEE